MEPKGCQHGAKIGEKSYQNRFKMRLLFQAGFYRDLYRKFASKSDEKSMKIVLAPRRKHVFSKIVFSLMSEFFNGFGMDFSCFLEVFLSIFASKRASKSS